MASTFSVGGLATGLDTNAIVDKLVELQSRPLAMLRKRQDGVKAQISVLGEITAKLTALETAARTLGDAGALAVKAASTNTAFSAAPGNGAIAGSYRLEVTSLAVAAKLRSAAFAPAETVRSGTLQVKVQDTTYEVEVEPGDTLQDVASALRAKAPVSAVVIDDGTSRYLSVTANVAGLPPGEGKTTADALALSYEAGTAGTDGVPLALDTVVNQATNAAFTVDGIPFTRNSNVVSDAVPGVALTLKVQGGPAEDLVLENDLDGTRAKLQAFADAYNGVLKLVQKQLAIGKDTDRSATLGGDVGVRSLQARLHALLTTKVPAAGAVQTLAELGFETSRTDGSASIDVATLGKALARDGASLNALFSTAATGLEDLTSRLVQGFVRDGDGVLDARKDGLERQIKRMDAEAIRLQAKIDAYRELLVRQFTAMEETVSRFKSAGTFLSSQLDARKNNS